MRPYCHTTDFWQVYFDTNKLIASTFGAAGFAPPFTVKRKEMINIDRDDTADDIAAVTKTAAARVPSPKA